MSGDPAVPGSRFARSTIRFLLFMIVLVAVVWVLRSGRLGPELTPAALREQVAAAGPLAPLVYLLALGILTNLMVPLSLMVVAGGLLFPWFTAFGLALPGALLADLIGYLVSAALLREPARRLLERMGWNVLRPARHGDWPSWPGSPPSRWEPRITCSASPGCPWGPTWALR